MLTVLTIAAVASLVISVAGVALKASAANELVGALNTALDINNMEGLKLFDTPYMNITSNALSMIVNFMQYSGLLVSVCAFIALIWNAFQMWCSTVEFKKFYADAVYKCLVVMILMNVYPTVITKTYNFATELGVEASGGEKTVITAFSGLAKQTKKIWNTGTASMIEQLQNGVGEDGKMVVDQNLIKTFTEYGMTEEEALAWAREKGIEVTTGKVKGSQKKAQKNAIKAFKNDTERQKYMKQSMAIIHAMSQVLTGTSDSAMADGSISATEILRMGDEALDNVFYNPYIKGTKRLSFSAMMKTAVIISECASAGAMSALEETDSSKQSSWEDLAKSKKPHLLFTFVGKLLINTFVYKILMLIAVAYCMIEYIVTLIEYLIVAAVSALLIPFFFIDATKQFAMNILKSVFSYFIKILVTTMMIFFVVSMYIDLGSLILARKDLDSIMSLLVYGCITMLGMVLVKNSGKIAGAVISGNPSMGLGDVVNQARGMSHAMHAASHEMKQFGEQLKKTGAAVKNVAHEGAIDSAAKGSILDGKEVAGRSHAAELQAQRSGVNFDHWNSDSGRAELSDLQSRWKSNPQSLSDNEKARMVQGEQAMDLTDDRIAARADKVARDYAKQARKQFAHDRMYNALTGMDAYADQNSIVRLGQQVRDKDGNWHAANWDDVQNAGKNGGGAFGRNAAKSNNNPKLDESVKLNSLGTPLDEPEVGR